MPNTHREKYLTNLLAGFAAVTIGIFTILYACFEKVLVSDWYFWAIIASVMICIGLYFFSTAIVHRVKAELKRRQKTKDHQKDITVDTV